MRLDAAAVRSRCRKAGKTLSTVLREAGVSRNAFYTLARSPNVLPPSIGKLARTLGVRERDLLIEPEDAVRRVHELLAELEQILTARPKVGRENAWHTLLLLDRPPIERLTRGLRRGIAGTVQR